MKTKCIGMFLPAIFLAGCMSKGNGPDMVQVAEADLASAGAPSVILPKLHALNQSEIQAGNLAATKACAADVKQYGQTLVSDHTAMDQQVSSMAQSQASNGSAAGSAGG